MNSLFGLVGYLGRQSFWLAVPILAIALVACRPTSVDTSPQAVTDTDGPQRLILEVEGAWGGEVRCLEDGSCRLGAVEHNGDAVSVYELRGRLGELIGRQEVAHHPDSAVWLDDETLIAAVEVSRSLDVFRVLDDGGIEPAGQIPLDIAPRTVRLLPPQAESGIPAHRLVVAPYSGSTVNYVEWSTIQSAEDAAVVSAKWCGTPWYPSVVERAPRHSEELGVAVACYDERRVIWMPQSALLKPAEELAVFEGVPRQVKPSPDGRWLYVAIELFGQNARIDMDSGEVQMLHHPEPSTFSVAPFADDYVIWGGDLLLSLQKFDSDGQVIETRWLPAAGVVEDIQLVDIDGDGEQDLVVFGAEEEVEILFGPLWDSASSERPEIKPPWAK